jgi:putative transposase
MFAVEPVVPRYARLVVPGLPMHLVQRGNNRAACFHAEADRSFYLFCLGRAAERFDCALHAYCLMPNHVHLLLTPATPEACAGLMKYVGQLQSQYMNRTYKRTGALWEGRYRSCVVQSETYLLACYRYIELNPVRAGLVEHPREYHWSSYRTNALNAPAGPITPHDEYLRLGHTELERKQTYGQLVASGIDEGPLNDIRLCTSGGHPLGDRVFQGRLSRVRPGSGPDRV